MKSTKAVPFENAIDLLDADHKAVKHMFIDYSALCEEGGPASEKGALAERICQALTVHAQIEEEIFYPEVRKALGDELIDEAESEHAEAKALIAAIQGMKPASDRYDDSVLALGKLVDAHVMEEREQIFLQAQQAPLDLRELAVPLARRKKELQAAAPKAKTTKSKESA